MYIVGWCKYRTDQYGTANFQCFVHSASDRQWNIVGIRVNLSPWKFVCTKAMFISKGSYGYGEPKNVNCWLVQIPHRPVRAGKLPMFRTLRKRPSIEY